MLKLDEVSKLINADMIDNKGKGVRVAVFDTGFTQHPAVKNVVGGKNFTHENSNDDYTDGHSHGTHTAGIISYFVPESELYICKVLTNRAIGLSFKLYEAIDYCIENKIRIINMSLCIAGDLNITREYIKKAVKNDILLVASASNCFSREDKTDDMPYPSFHDNIICVGASDEYGRPARFNNPSDRVDIIAPGSQVVSCDINGGYIAKSGTSQAVPIVTAMAAKILGENPYMSQWELYKKLIECTADMGFSRKFQGCGLIDLSKYTVLRD